MLVEALGPVAADHVWHRYTTPDTWPSWAPHLKRVDTEATTLEPGVTGKVEGPKGLTLDFTVEKVDPRLRSWSWRVGRGSLAVLMHHDAVPAARGGTRATLRVGGGVSAVIQPYRLLARAALRRLVSDPAGGIAPVDAVTEFPFDFATSYAVAGRAFGVTPDSATVEVGPRWLYVGYGPWRLLTPLSNVSGVRVTEDFSWVKTAGPPHLSFADKGVSFTTNGERALCICFHEPVAAIDPTGTIRHPAATVSVQDPEALAAALTSG